MGAILGTLVIGLVVGAIAKLLMPGRDPGGCLVTILLGIAGAFVAHAIGRRRANHSARMRQDAGQNRLHLRTEQWRRRRPL